MTTQHKVVPVPAPVPTKDTKEFWAACKNHELLVPRCKQCGAILHYTYLVCPECSSTERELFKVSGKGTIYSWIELTHPPTPAFEPILPLNVILVDIEGAPGFRLLSNLVDFQPADLKIGTPVEVVYEDLNETITLPKFRPARK